MSSLRKHQKESHYFDSEVLSCLHYKTLLCMSCNLNSLLIKQKNLKHSVMETEKEQSYNNLDSEV